MVYAKVIFPALKFFDKDIEDCLSKVSKEGQDLIYKAKKFGVEQVSEQILNNDDMHAKGTDFANQYLKQTEANTNEFVEVLTDNVPLDVKKFD